MLALVIVPLQGYAAMGNDMMPCHDLSAMQDDGDMDCHSDAGCGVDVDQKCAGSCTNCGTCSTTSFVPSLEIEIEIVLVTEQLPTIESYYPQPPSFVEPRPPNTPV